MSLRGPTAPLLGCVIAMSEAGPTSRRFRQRSGSWRFKLVVVLGLLCIAGSFYFFGAGNFRVQTLAQYPVDAWTALQAQATRESWALSPVQRRGLRALGQKMMMSTGEEAAHGADVLDSRSRHSQQQQQQQQVRPRLRKDPAVDADPFGPAAAPDLEDGASSRHAFFHANGSSAVVVAANVSADLLVVEPVIGHADALARATTSLYDLSATSIYGMQQHLAVYRGKVALVVNMAVGSKYGDDNLHGLLQTYKKYKPYGFVVLGFDCDQFPEHNGPEVETLLTYNDVDYPMFAKVNVNGPDAHPVFKFLRRQLPTSMGGGGGVGPGNEFTANFQKILVDPSGQPVKAFGSVYDSPQTEVEVHRMLSELIMPKA